MTTLGRNHTCNGVCEQYRVITREYNKENNVKKCVQECGVFMKYDGIYCPCCGYQLRVKPRSPKMTIRIQNNPHHRH